MDMWACANDVILYFSRPGKPTDNAYSESFNGSLRSECLNAHWFITADDARQELEAWHRDYITARPHSATGSNPTISLLNRAERAAARWLFTPENLPAWWSIDREKLNKSANSPNSCRIVGSQVSSHGCFMG